MAAVFDPEAQTRRESRHYNRWIDREEWPLRTRDFGYNRRAYREANDSSGVLIVESALVFDRLQFAFTVMFHYLFPQLTMGLAPLILYLRTRALRAPNGHHDRAARFWTKLFAVNFAFGVVTGIPLEFQFGTNWARFSNFAGGVIGQTLAMEGVFAFFLESFFLGVLLFGASRFEPKMQWFAALMVFLGTWLSGYFILVTNAWMQHPVAYSAARDGNLQLESFWGLLMNPWVAWQYAHTMIATLATA